MLPSIVLLDGVLFDATPKQLLLLCRPARTPCHLREDSVLWAFSNSMIRQPCLLKLAATSRRPPPPPPAAPTTHTSIHTTQQPKQATITRPRLSRCARADGRRYNHTDSTGRRGLRRLCPPHVRKGRGAGRARGGGGGGGAPGSWWESEYRDTRAPSRGLKYACLLSHLLNSVFSDVDCVAAAPSVAPRGSRTDCPGACMTELYPFLGKIAGASRCQLWLQ